MAGFNAKEVKNTGAKGHFQEPLEAGTYPARLSWLVMLGVQEQMAFQGQAKESKLEILLGYEFLDEFCVDENGNLEEDKPRFLSENFPFYNLEADRARSTVRYLSLDPSQTFGGDWTQLVGTPLNLTVVQKKSRKTDRVYNNVASVSKMRTKDAERFADEGVLDTRIFNIYEPDLDVFLALPQWIQDKIKGAVDFAETPLKDLLSNQEEKEEDAPKQSKKPSKEEEGDDTPW